MTSISEENKDIAIKFFKALSSGSETYLNYYNDDSICLLYTSDAADE